MKATFHLVTGFLGSGKTTLLDRLLGQLSGQHRIAVVQNEFAPSGVDAVGGASTETRLRHQAEWVRLPCQVAAPARTPVSSPSPGQGSDRFQAASNVPI